MPNMATPLRGPVEVKLVMTSSSFWLRLRLNLRLLLRRLWWLVVAGFVLPTLMLLVTFMGDGWPFEMGRAEVFLLAVAGNIALLVVPNFLITVLRSALPSDHERLLPRAVTFHPDGVKVEPRGSDAYEDSYAFVLSATPTRTGLELKIGEDPLRILHITPRMIGAERFRLVQFWLGRHGKLSA